MFFVTEIMEKVMKDMSRALNVTLERANTILSDVSNLLLSIYTVHHTGEV